MDLSGKRLVVFGCGYLGRQVVEKALERKMEVTALTRNEADAEFLKGHGLEKIVLAERHEDQWYSEIAPEPDVALICVGSGGRGLDGYRQSYVEGVRSVLNWAENYGKIGTLIFTSSTSVYPQNDEQWVGENDSADGSSEGAKILLEAEELLKTSNVVGRWFIFRLGGIYGPGRHHLLNRARSGEFAEEEGDQVFLNSIHVTDAAQAVIAAAGSGEKVAGGIFNIVDDHPERKGEIVRYLREQVRDQPAPTAANSPSNKKRRRVGPRPSRKISNRKAREILGWKPHFSDYRSGYAALLNIRE